MTQRALFPIIPDDIRHRVMRALADEDLSPCAHQVLQRLIRFPECAGRDRAISIGRIQDWARMNGYKVFGDREIKSAAKELLELRGVPIGSARTEPCGYYICVDTGDREAAVRPIRAEVFSLLNRWSVLDSKSSIAAELAGQMGISECADKGEAA